MSNLEELRK